MERASFFFSFFLFFFSLFLNNETEIGPLDNSYERQAPEKLLAGTDHTKSILYILVSRSQVLKVMRHYLRAQSQGHHTIDRLENRGVERGSARRSSLKGRERTKAKLGKLLRDGVERIWDFRAHIYHLKLDLTELNWTSRLVEGGGGGIRHL